MEDAKELMFRRGERDGLEGLNPSSTSKEYMEGYVQGRRTRIEKRIKNGDYCECSHDEGRFVQW